MDRLPEFLGMANHISTIHKGRIKDLLIGNSTYL